MSRRSNVQRFRRAGPKTFTRKRRRNFQRGCADAYRGDRLWPLHLADGGKDRLCGFEHDLDGIRGASVGSHALNVSPEGPFDGFLVRLVLFPQSAAIVHNFGNVISVILGYTFTRNVIINVEVVFLRPLQEHAQIFVGNFSSCRICFCFLRRRTCSCCN